MTTALADNAIEILRENDRGSYTVPTQGLYPFQWNWDSCLTALGQAHFDDPDLLVFDSNDRITHEVGAGIYAEDAHTIYPSAA